MSITLFLSSTHMPDDSLQDLTYQLCVSLRSECENYADVLQNPSIRKQDKGDPLSVGTIVMSLIGTGGVVVAFVNVLKSYVDRGQHLSVKVKSKSGDEVEITADNLKPDQIRETTALVSRLLEKS
jgi:hypothetical protein